MAWVWQLHALDMQVCDVTLKLQVQVKVRRAWGLTAEARLLGAEPPLLQYDQ